MKPLRKLQILFTFCITCLFLFASSPEKEIKESKTNLYEYGGVRTCEDNIKNLFRNFPILIENGEVIDFISYKHIGTIKNKRQAKKYSKKNFNDLIPIGWHTTSERINGKLVGNASIRLTAGEIPETKSELMDKAKTIADVYVNVGDELFVVDYVYEMKKHSHYIFINPNTKSVLLEGNIFGIDIPVSDIEQSENKIENIDFSDYVHIKPKESLSSDELELFNKLEKVIIENTSVVNNKFSFSLDKDSFINMGIPEKYYTLLMKNIEDNNKFVEDNQFFDVDFDTSWQETVKAYKERNNEE